MDPSPYSVDARVLTEWILRQRPDFDDHRRSLSVDLPARSLIEREPDEQARVRPGLTVFLTNRECPWRCLMCDLWQHTTREQVPPGAITRQIEAALSGVGAHRLHWLKLYNAGSFFDSGAIPVADHFGISQLCRRFDRVVVECHPSLVGERVESFRNQLGSMRLEVAMGLETAHPETLARLNKGMTRDDFSRAAEWLRARDIDVRAFVLVRPPFLDEEAALEWANRSTEFAFQAGVNTISLIPTRGGNGALEALAQAGQFAPPRLATLEAAFDHALNLGRGRVFADLWDLGRFAVGEPRFAERRSRLEAMNLRQMVLPRVA
jgi:radical SAM enzyme (TIGR01210 family)